MNDKPEMKKPFFANFLEAQLSETEDIQGGGGPSPTNLKLDSVTHPRTDSVTRPSGDMVTLKYPSDGDDDPPTVPM